MQAQEAMIQAALKLARNLWRESRLVCAYAPPWMIARVVDEQPGLRKSAARSGVTRDALLGALYSVVLKQAATAVNEDRSRPTATALCGFYRAAEVLEKRHGFRVQFVLDAVAEASA